MDQKITIFQELKQFIHFDDAGDGQRLQSLAPVFAEHGPILTAAFYQRLESNPETAKLIEGRVETLKQTHTRWMNQLFAGGYAEAYFESRYRIGLTHARVGVPPRWCEAIISFLRTESLPIVMEHVGDANAFASHYSSLVKILDLDLMLINLAYEDERLRRLTDFTGMSRKLIERCINKASSPKKS